MADEPKLRTKLLFKWLLKFLKPELVCDVGSMDASEALWFARVLPQARVMLFEANPVNFQAIARRPEVAQKQIMLVGKAAWRENGSLSFFVEQPGETPGEAEHLRGISSTRPRRNPDESKGNVQVTVEAVRLDSCLGQLVPVPASVALWIDVEGAAYEVLEGTRGLAERLVLLHLEVETREFWQNQKLKPEVLALASSLGFVPLARGRTEEQHDLVLVQRRVLAAYPFRIGALVWLARLVSLNLKAIPAMLRGWSGRP